MNKGNPYTQQVLEAAVKDLYDSLSGCIEASDNESFEQRFESEKHGRRVLERVKEELREVGVEMRLSEEDEEGNGMVQDLLEKGYWTNPNSNLIDEKDKEDDDA